MSSALDEYREVSPKGTVDFLYRLSDLVKGKSFLHVNAVRYGGGMSEVLRRLVPMMNALGVDTRWEVIAGTQEYFVVVKRLLNALQGRDEKITDDMYHTYLDITERNAQGAQTRSGPGHGPRPSTGGLGRLPDRTDVGCGDVIWIWPNLSAAPGPFSDGMC